MPDSESIDTVLERQAKIVSTLQKTIEAGISRHPTSDEVQKIQLLSESLHYNTLVWQAMIAAANEPSQSDWAKGIEDRLNKKFGKR